MFRVGAGLLFLIIFLAPSHAPLAQELLESTDEDLVAREEVRSAVETALNNYLSAPGPRRIDVALEGIQSLIPYGERAVPYLANELEQESYGSYDFVAYALGFLEVPAAAAALREAIELAEVSPGRASLARKAWACWALGLHHEIDALKLVNAGTHRSGEFPMHQQMSVLEAIALQTAPEAVPVLLEQFETWGETEDKREDRRFVLRALRRLGHPSGAPTLIEIIEQEKADPELRAQAADALRSVATTDSVAALGKALKDPVPGVRRSAAFALKWMDQPGDVKPLLEHLATEDDRRVRELLYQVIAAHAKPEQLPLFFAQGNRPDPEDRRLFVMALRRVEGEEKLPILSAALQDPSEAVAMLAIDPLAKYGGRASMDRLGEVLASTASWVLVNEIAKAARANGFTGLAPTLTQRLLEALQYHTGNERGVMSAVDSLAGALIDFGHTAALPELRRVHQSTKDPMMIEVLDGTIDALELLRANDKDVAKWALLLRDPNAARGRLARNRLAKLGGEQGTAVMLEAYDDLEILARIDTLQLMEERDSPAVRELLRRLLLDPESYSVKRERELRTAAWIARSLGDQEMLDLLTEAVRLREGRDIENLIYAAAIGRKKVLPLIREYRLSRLRFLGMERGFEQEVLDWIMRRLENGLPIERYDQPARKLVIR